jgi:mannose-6-phosphate isomerase-like protein (cupin superfamily)
VPVMRGPADQPGWVAWSNFGIGVVHDAGAFDRHFHDADEYWVVISGRARVMSEGREYVIGPGDVLATRMGDEHDILEIIEGPLRTFWFEDRLRGQRRPGHLHRPGDEPGDPDVTP